MIGLPPLGGFWALLKLIDDLWFEHPWLIGVLLIVNALSAFSMMREFGLIFAGRVRQMTARSPENFWLISLPMMGLLGLILHLPLILHSFSLLPDWASANKEAILLLLGSTVIGLGSGAALYVGQTVSKPIRLPWQSVQNFFAYDLYTPTLYRSSIVLSVDWASRFADWCDRFIVDGFVNLVGWFSLVGGEALKYSNSGQGQFYIFTIALSSIAIAIVIAWSFISPPISTLCSIKESPTAHAQYFNLVPSSRGTLDWVLARAHLSIEADCIIPQRCSAGMESLDRLPVRL